MTNRKNTNNITTKRLYRAVASSSAIETGLSVSEIETKLKDKQSKYSRLALASN